MYTFLFNPQNDLALANGSPTFTAPRAAVELARAGACLPMWYGSEGDRFVGAVNGAWFDEMRRAFGIDCMPSTRVAADTVPSPWGWSPQTRRYLLELGCDEALLPGNEAIERMRDMSSRTASAPLLRNFMESLPGLTAGNPERHFPRIARSLDEAMAAIEAVGTAMIKLPWSNAGRGQQVSDRTTPDELRRRVEGMINRQGAVEITPCYSRRLDFAMLWDKGRFAGYSLFGTDTHGGWTHNELMSDAEIERRIALCAGRDVPFEAMRDCLDRLLSDNPAPCGEGTAGIDFVVGDDADGTCIVVPVEINRRRTMGHVAHALSSRFLSPGSHGTFSICPRASAPHPFARVTEAKVDNRRLADGHIDMAEPGGAFRFIFAATEKRL